MANQQAMSEAAIEPITQLTFTATDLKQYEYCPRIVYYTYCLPLWRPTTFKMEAGAQAHETAPGLERRRSLKAYRLDDGQREFDMWLESARLGLRGRVDMVITRSDEVIPVEYKDSPGRGGPGWILQLAAYGVMLEELLGRAARRSFIYFIPQRRAREFELTTTLKTRVGEAAQAMRDMVEFERMPSPASQRAKCRACEFRRFCNDV
jgi:CRISPR-associated exonuclease Cas4